MAKLDGKTALVTALDPGPLTYKENGSTTRLDLGSGFAEVRDNVMTVLVESGGPAA